MSSTTTIPRKRKPKSSAASPKKRARLATGSGDCVYLETYGVSGDKDVASSASSASSSSVDSSDSTAKRRPAKSENKKKKEKETRVMGIPGILSRVLAIRALGTHASTDVPMLLRVHAVLRASLLSTLTEAFAFEFEDAYDDRERALQSRVRRHLDNKFGEAVGDLVDDEREKRTERYLAALREVRAIYHTECCRSLKNTLRKFGGCNIPYNAVRNVSTYMDKVCTAIHAALEPLANEWIRDRNIADDDILSLVARPVRENARTWIQAKLQPLLDQHLPAPTSNDNSAGDSRDSRDGLAELAVAFAVKHASSLLRVVDSKTGKFRAHVPCGYHASGDTARKLEAHLVDAIGGITPERRQPMRGVPTLCGLSIPDHLLREVLSYCSARRLLITGGVPVTTYGFTTTSPRGFGLVGLSRQWCDFILMQLPRIVHTLSLVPRSLKALPAHRQSVHALMLLYRASSTKRRGDDKLCALRMLVTHTVPLKREVFVGAIPPRLAQVHTLTLLSPANWSSDDSAVTGNTMMDHLRRTFPNVRRLVLVGDGLEARGGSDRAVPLRSARDAIAAEPACDLVSYAAARIETMAKMLGDVHSQCCVRETDELAAFHLPELQCVDLVLHHEQHTDNDSFRNRDHLPPAPYVVKCIKKAFARVGTSDTIRTIPRLVLYTRYDVEMREALDVLRAEEVSFDAATASVEERAQHSTFFQSFASIDVRSWYERDRHQENNNNND